MEDKLLKLKGFRRLDAGYRKLSGCAELGAQSSRGRSSPRAPGSAQTPRKAPLVRGGPLGTCPACPRHAPTPSLPPRETRSQSSEGHSNANPRSQRPTSPGSHGAVAGVRAGLWRRPLRGLVRDTVRPAGLAAPAQCRSLTSASRRGVHKRPPRPPVSVTREGTGPFPQPSSCRGRADNELGHPFTHEPAWESAAGDEHRHVYPWRAPADALRICASQQGPGPSEPCMHFPVRPSV